MGLDLWFRQDLRRIITSKAQAALRLPQDDYQRGYLDALADMAIEFGLPEDAGCQRRLPSSTPDQ